jgi:hypothetical protein
MGKSSARINFWRARSFRAFWHLQEFDSQGRDAHCPDPQAARDQGKKHPARGRRSKGPRSLMRTSCATWVLGLEMRIKRAKRQGRGWPRGGIHIVFFAAGGFAALKFAAVPAGLGGPNPNRLYEAGWVRYERGFQPWATRNINGNQRKAAQIMKSRLRIFFPHQHGHAEMLSRSIPVRFKAQSA